MKNHSIISFLFFIFTFSSHIFGYANHGVLVLANNPFSQFENKSIRDNFNFRFGADSNSNFSKGAWQPETWKAYKAKELDSMFAKIQSMRLGYEFKICLNELAATQYTMTNLLQNAKPMGGDAIAHVKQICALVEFRGMSASMQKVFHETISKLTPLLFDGNGHIKQFLTLPEVKAYDRIVADFCNKANACYALDGAIDCCRIALHEQGNTFKNHLSSHRTGQSAFTDLFLQKDMKALCELNDLCNAQKFEQAYIIVQNNNYRFIDNQANNFFKLEYVDRFYKTHNNQGIEKKYLDLPYYKQHLKNLPESMVASKHNMVLAKQYAFKQDILNACNITQLSPCTAQVVDKILELHHAQGLQAGIDYCCIQLSADHPNPEMRTTYWDLHHANSSLKFANPNAEVASFKFSADIHTAAHAQDRKLINELGSLDTSKFYIKNGLNQALKYVECSLNGDTFAASYRSLAHKMGDALLGRRDSYVLGLPDFAIHLPDATQESIKDHVVKFVDDTLLDSRINFNNLAQNTEKIERVSDAYGQMVNGNKIDQAYLNYALKQYPCDMAIAMDTRNFRKETNPTEIAYICGHIEKYAAACFDRMHNGVKTTMVAYEVNPTMCIDLLREGKNPLAYQKQSGDQVFHVEAQYELHNIRKHAEISRMDMHPALRNVLEFGARSTFAVKTYLNVQAYHKAFQTNVLAHCTFSNIERAIKVTGKLGFDTIVGVEEGVVQGASNFVHTVMHPVETVKNVVNVGTKGVKFVSLMGRMCRASLTSPEEYNKVLAEFNQKVSPVLDAISESASKATWRDVVRETTAFLCDAKITNGALRSVGKLASVTKQGASNVLQKVVAASTERIPQLEVAIVGIEELGLKATQTAEISALSEAQEAAKQGAKVSEVVASGIENAETKAAQVIEDATAQAKKITKLGAATEALIAEFNPAHYDPAIVDPQMLAKAVEVFKDVEGSFGQCGPLKQVLEGAQLGSECTSSLKGAVYELEKALKLNIEGRQVLKLGGKVPRMHVDGKTVMRICEVDVITKDAFIECKNWFWEKVNLRRIEDLKEQLTILKDAALQHGKNLELHSKHSIPPDLKDWLIQKKIIFYEG